jgi:circadian clock protein KaiB
LKPPTRHLFRLYVAEGTQNSALAANNLASYCSKNLPDLHQIEVINVLAEPELALADKIFMTPTLIRMMPKPPLRIVGRLGDVQSMSQMLDVASAVA